MQHPKQSSVKTVKRIFDLLICAPSYPAEICRKTGLHRNTVNGALRFLVQNGLVSKERKGRRVLHSLVLAGEGGQVLWTELTRPKKEEQLIRRKTGNPLSNSVFRRELDREISNLRERFGELAGAPSNDELIGALMLIHKDLAPEAILGTIRKPFCLECLSSTTTFFPMRLIEDSNEFCCPNCGITIPKISTETDQPIENPEDAKRLKAISDAEKKKKSYTEIERLLTKYKEGKTRITVRKRKSAKTEQ
jgi:DNA-binding transcriptional ArsR family regulator